MEKKPGRSIQEKNAQKRTRLDLDGLPEADIKSKLVTISAYGIGIYSQLIAIWNMLLSVENHNF